MGRNPIGVGARLELDTQVSRNGKPGLKVATASRYLINEDTPSMTEWLEDFRATINSASQRLLQIGETESERPRAEEHWSAKQILGHLIDSATNNHARFVTAQIKDDLVFPGYDQNNWVEIQHYQQASWSRLVDLWRAYNLHLLHVMASTPADKLSRRCVAHSFQQIAFETIKESEPATLEYLMKDYVVHLKHHLDQIFDKRADQGNGAKTASN